MSLMIRISLVFVLALTSAVISGCASASRLESESAQVPLAELLDYGFDLASTDDAWRTGDTIVYEIESCDGHRTRRSFLRCRVLDQPKPDAWPASVPRRFRYVISLPDAAAGGDQPPVRKRYRLRSSIVLAELEILDEKGGIIAYGPTGLPREFLAGGFHDALIAMNNLLPVMQSTEDAAAPEVVRRRHDLLMANRDMAGALFSVQFLMNQKHVYPLLLGILREVIRPTIFQLFSQRVSLSYLRDDQTRFEPATQILQGHHFNTMTFDLRFGMGGQMLSTSTVYVVPPDPPFHVCGGVLAVEGRSIKDLARWYRICLVSARRGAAAPAP